MEICNVNKCKGCRFYKRHLLVDKDDVKTLAISCEITEKTLEPNAYGNFRYDLLTKQCPFENIDYIKKLEKKWVKLSRYIEHELITCDKMVKEMKGMPNESKYKNWKDILEDIMRKIQSLDKE